MSNILTCSNAPFSTTTFVQCAVPVASQGTVDGANFIGCSVPFTLNGNYFLCTGTRHQITDLNTADSSLYVATADDVISAFNYVQIPSGSIENFTVADYLASVAPDPDPSSGTTLTAADYSALLSLVIPSFVIAWSFKMIVRQILNR